MAEMPQQNAPNYIPGSKNEWGSVTVITAGVLAVVGAISFAVVTLGVAANNRARAQAVADLGSLAGATADLEVAAQIVAINGAILVSATQVGEAVDVSVSVGDSQASARAERSYAPWNPIDTGPGVTDDIETTTIALVAAPTTTRTLIFPTIPPPTTRVLIFATIPQTPPPTTRTVPTTQKPKPRR